jgi:hypothetical protein
LLLVRHPLFHFNQTMVGPFDFPQYLLCVRILFAMCVSLRTFGGFDVLTQPQYGGRHHLLHRPIYSIAPTLLIRLYAAQSSPISRLGERAWSALTQRREIDSSFSDTPAR